MLRTLGIVAALCPISTVAIAQSPRQHGEWRTRVRQEMPLMGHRNWIAVVDSAYPLQTSPGIETVETDSDQLDVVRRVLHEVGESKHVSPGIFTDAELSAAREDAAPGAPRYSASIS